MKHSPRGVFKAHWMGPKGEIVLLAITSTNRLVIDPVTIPFGADHIGTVDGLWEMLDHVDPTKSPTAFRNPPRSRLVPRNLRTRWGMRLLPHSA